jgi:hypothetical protein
VAAVKPTQGALESKVSEPDGDDSSNATLLLLRELGIHSTTVVCIQLCARHMKMILYTNACIASALDDACRSTPQHKLLRSRPLWLVTCPAC